jgi:hypothetical protein
MLPYFVEKLIVELFVKILCETLFSLHLWPFIYHQLF